MHVDRGGRCDEVPAGPARLQDPRDQLGHRRPEVHQRLGLPQVLGAVDVLDAEQLDEVLVGVVVVEGQRELPLGDLEDLRPRTVGVAPASDEFGPLNLQPHPGRQWAERSGKHKDPDREPRPRRRATYTRPHGVRHLFPADDLGTDKPYGHIKPGKNRTRFLEFHRYLPSPPEIRIAIVLDSFSPHLTTKKDTRVGDWATANNVELAYTPTDSSWLNRIEAQFTALRYLALDGTDHAADERLREVVNRVNVA